MKKILIIYTGGTIGMIYNEVNKTFIPFDFKQIFNQVPEVKRMGLKLTVQSFRPPIDSSNMQPQHWAQIAKAIELHYNEFDGFVVLHGSDTMAYTASALSFMLENLSKPVILTGSQLPVGEIRTDAKENLITSLEIASCEFNGKPAVPEVCIYFDFNLYRGNRTSKYNSEKFEAFQSVNYPVLAEAGVHLKFNHQFINKSTSKQLSVSTVMANEVGILKIFPGITKNWMESVMLAPGVRAIILETFGAGNTPNEPWVKDIIKRTAEAGRIIVNITQCGGGRVDQGRYETSRHLEQAGVISGFDLTTEAALTKLMFLLGKNYNNNRIKEQFQKNLRGEMTN
ncbi:MAG: type I asparaginase [Bacteroidia bacterium]|nr:type I asparaginase [Bacteroidia bacterium]MCZ2277988.1 type I asparaginase [Bacteroidia bacterium]